MSIVPKWKALKITELALWTPTLSEEQPPAEGPGQEEAPGAAGTEHPSQGFQSSHPEVVRATTPGLSGKASQGCQGKCPRVIRASAPGSSGQVLQGHQGKHLRVIRASAPGVFRASALGLLGTYTLSSDLVQLVSLENCLWVSLGAGCYKGKCLGWETPGNRGKACRPDGWKECPAMM